MARRSIWSPISPLQGRARRIGLPAAAVGALVVAEVAVLLLRPKGVIAPVPVSESSYFSSAELERARDFSGGQRLLALGAIAAQGAILAVVVARPPLGALRFAERVGRRRAIVTGAVVGVGLATSIQLAGLPFRALAHERAVDFGLSTQEWKDWVWDALKAGGIGIVFAAGGAALFLGLMRRFRRRWWLAGAGVVVGIEVLLVWLGPVVLAPIFNRFEPLPEGRTRADVIELAREADVDVGQVFVVDASRRTRGANAFVTGIGQTKRVVLYDTLMDRFSPSQVRLVVAHELGHVKNRDVPRGMLWVALVAPLGMYLVKQLTERWSGRAGAEPGAPGCLPAFALALALVSFAGGVVSNQLSRQVEARADSFALELTGEPREFVAMEKELVLANLSDPDPPPVLVALFATHPPAVERIGAAVAFERERANP